MKFKVTNREVKNHYQGCVYSLGYCELYDFLHYSYNEPIAYNCGVYGWNYDLFVINGVAITTGYRNMVGNRLPENITNIYKKYQKRLQKIRALYWENNYTVYREKSQKALNLYYKKFEKALKEL